MHFYETEIALAIVSAATVVAVLIAIYLIFILRTAQRQFDRAHCESDWIANSFVNGSQNDGHKQEDDESEIKVSSKEG